MFVFIRALTYATIFISLVLIFVPAQVLSWSGIVGPESIRVEQIAGIVIAIVGAGIALWSVFTFILIGKGTPAPFDPPRQLVIKGPYRFVRNPMYIGASSALAGAALFYESVPLFGYAVLFLLICHLFVVWYEEPTLRQTFGDSYENYCKEIRRWQPKIPK